MRLKSVYISQYKNLRGFTLSFAGSSFIDVFVGENGHTGGTTAVDLC
jgi:recombinational DNA repair ATPase RecF